MTYRARCQGRRVEQERRVQRMLRRTSFTFEIVGWYRAPALVASSDNYVWPTVSVDREDLRRLYATPPEV